MRSLILFALVSFAPFAWAQNKLGMGLIFNKERYEQTPMKAPLMRGDYMGMPATASLKKYCPVPQNQGEYGTCVGWSSSYAARTIMEARQNQWTDPNQISKQAFAPGFLYKLVKDPSDVDCMQGLVIEDALDEMKRSGVPKYTTFSESCTERIPNVAYTEAKKYILKDYARVFGDYDSYDTKVQAVKKSIYEGKPVVIGMLCAPSFGEAKNCWQPSEQASYNFGGHAMCIIGYDDNRCGGAFEIMNSWGTDWGNKGFIWIPYRVFDDFVKYAYEVIDFPKAAPKTADLSGKIRIELLDGGDMTAVMANNSGIYKTTKPYYSGTKFRILISNNEPAYVYAFGSDLSKKSYSIFPHKVGISPALTYKQNNVAIPSEDHHVKMDEKVGKDYLCVIYSRDAIDIQKVMRSMESQAGDFATRLKAVLGDRLVSPENIQFTAGQMNFSAVSNGKSAVALMLEIEHK
jgi:Papain family cysteine protease/Domain of unknown function (DUF4384)